MAVTVGLVLVVVAAVTPLGPVTNHPIRPAVRDPTYRLPGPVVGRRPDVTAVSPDGRWVVLRDSDHPDHQVFYLAHLDAGTVRLTQHANRGRVHADVFHCVPSNERADRCPSVSS